MVARTRGARRSAPSPPQQEEAAAAAPQPPQTAKELRAAWAHMDESNSREPEPEPEPEPEEPMMSPAATDAAMRALTLTDANASKEAAPAPVRRSLQFDLASLPARLPALTIDGCAAESTALTPNSYDAQLLGLELETAAAEDDEAPAEAEVDLDAMAAELGADVAAAADDVDLDALAAELAADPAGIEDALYEEAAEEEEYAEEHAAEEAAAEEVEAEPEQGDTTELASLNAQMAELAALEAQLDMEVEAQQTPPAEEKPQPMDVLQMMEGTDDVDLDALTAELDAQEEPQGGVDAELAAEMDELAALTAQLDATEAAELQQAAAAAPLEFAPCGSHAADEHMMQTPERPTGVAAAPAPLVIKNVTWVRHPRLDVPVNLEYATEINKKPTRRGNTSSAQKRSSRARSRLKKKLALYGAAKMAVV